MTISFSEPGFTGLKDIQDGLCKLGSVETQFIASLIQIFSTIYAETRHELSLQS